MIRAYAWIGRMWIVGTLLIFPTPLLPSLRLDERRDETRKERKRDDLHVCPGERLSLSRNGHERRSDWSIAL
jgi:hypothetical protein